MIHKRTHGEVRVGVLTGGYKSSAHGSLGISPPSLCDWDHEAPSAAVAAAGVGLLPLCPSGARHLGAGLMWRCLISSCCETGSKQNQRGPDRWLHLHPAPSVQRAHCPACELAAVDTTEAGSSLAQMSNRPVWFKFIMREWLSVTW